MPVLLSNGERNESIPDGIPCWGHFPSCHHFTSGWMRVMPLLSICAFLTFMVIFSGRRTRYELGSTRGTFVWPDTESSIFAEGNTIQRLDETTPLLRADSWRRDREAMNHPTPATLSSMLVCAICLDSIKVRHKIRELGCLHVFHHGCIGSWWVRGHSLCPLCRQSMVPPKRIGPRIP